MVIYFACLGGSHKRRYTVCVLSLWLLSLNITGAFFLCPLEAGACISVDQVVRGWAVGIIWENVYKLLAQCPERGGHLIQFHSLPPSMTWALLHFWSRILSAPIPSTELLPVLLLPLLTSTLNLDSLPLATRGSAVSAPGFYSLCSTQEEPPLLWGLLRIFFQQQDKANPGGAHTSVSHPSFFTMTLHWQVVLIHISEDGSLH